MMEPLRGSGMPWNIVFIVLSIWLFANAERLH